MKRLLAGIFLVLGAFTIMSAAEAMGNKAGSLGIGGYISGGVANGISTKYWIDAENAVDAVLSFASGDYEYTHFHADYLKHRYNLVMVEEGEIPLYFGLGIFMESSTLLSADTVSTNGIRLPVGFSYLLKDAPMDVFMEVAPTVVSGDNNGFYIAGAFGFRYSF